MSPFSVSNRPGIVKPLRRQNDDDQPTLFMTIRCENAQTRRETGKRSREGGRRTLCGTLAD